MAIGVRHGVDSACTLTNYMRHDSKRLYKFTISRLWRRIADDQKSFRTPLYKGNMPLGERSVMPLRKKIAKKYHGVDILTT